MKQSHRYFFGYLPKKLEARGQPLSLPWEWLTCDKICGQYPIYGRIQEEINDLIARLKKDNFSLCKERTAKGYLGLKVVHRGNKTTSEDRFRVLIVSTAYSEIEFYYYLVVYVHTAYIHADTCT